MELAWGKIISDRNTEFMAVKFMYENNIETLLTQSYEEETFGDENQY